MRNLQRKGNRFYARLGVPPELREIMGRREFIRSLSADKAEALRLLPAVLADFHRQIDAYRPGIKSFAAEARRLYEIEIAADKVERFAEPLAYDPRPEYERRLRRIAAGVETDKDAIAAAIGYALEIVGISKDAPSYHDAAKALAQARLAALTGDKAPELPQEPIPLMGLFDAYIKELQAAGRGKEAEKRWRPVIAQFVKYLAHDDARKITRQDVIRWKDSLLASGRSSKSVRDSNLTALKAGLRPMK